MSEDHRSTWIQEAFGQASEAVLPVIAQAIRQAHEDSHAAHVAAQIGTEDAYGHSMKVASYERLAEAFTAFPEVTVSKIRGRHIIVFAETGAALHPWRYARDGHTDRDNAKMPTSEVNLKRYQTEDDLGGFAVVDGSLCERSEEEIDDELEIRRQINNMGRTITVGYASNSTRLFDIGIGEMTLADTITGRVHWHNWKALNRLSEPATTPSALRVATETVPAFADAPLDDMQVTARNEDTKSGSD